MKQGGDGLQKRERFMLLVPQITEGPPENPVKGNLQYQYTLLKTKTEKTLEEKFKAQLKISIDGTEHTVRAADIRILHRILMSTLVNFQKECR